MDLESLPLSLAVFVAATAVIVLAGTGLAKTADRIADQTGLGEALMGSLLLAAVTSLPDLTATLTAAVDDRPELAMSNILGSMAINLAFLGIADLFYRRANLEHAAASSVNLMLTGLMLTLLVIPLLAMALPETSYWGVHPVTPLLLIVYLLGFRLVRRTQISPMWTPRRTSLTFHDQPRKTPAGKRSLPSLWLKFGLLSLLVSIAGFLLMVASETIASETVLTDTSVGGLLTAFSTSSPELVTTIAAVRAGAPALAVGNILGTNCFNVLVIGVTDIAYRDSSIYHAISPFQVVWGLVTILMASILLLGFIYRQQYGIARIGFESFLILVIYIATVGLMLFV